MAVPKEPGKSSAVRSGPVKNQKKNKVTLVGAYSPSMKVAGVARKVPKSHPAGRPEWPGEKSGRHVTHTGVAVVMKKPLPKPKKAGTR